MRQKPGDVMTRCNVRPASSHTAAATTTAKAHASQQHACSPAMARTCNVPLTNISERSRHKCRHDGAETCRHGHRRHQKAPVTWDEGYGASDNS